jgi:acetyltransferase-like isoleucine patch superfamily enzyme
MNIKQAMKLALMGVYSRVAPKLFEGFCECEMRRWRRCLAGCGERTKIHPLVRMMQADKIYVGSDVTIVSFAHIWGAGGVHIGDRAMIGSHSAITP